jgi:hypothetical protein
MSRIKIKYKEKIILINFQTKNPLYHNTTLTSNARLLSVNVERAEISSLF